MFKAWWWAWAREAGGHRKVKQKEFTKCVSLLRIKWREHNLPHIRFILHFFFKLMSKQHNLPLRSPSSGSWIPRLQCFMGSDSTSFCLDIAEYTPAIHHPRIGQQSGHGYKREDGWATVMATCSLLCFRLLKEMVYRMLLESGDI